MVQRIDMGMAVAMARHTEEAHAERETAFAHWQVMHERHEMDGGIGIVRACRLVDRDGHRDGAAALHQARGRGDLVGCDVIQGATVVIRAPTAPVLHMLEHLIESREAHASVKGQGSGHCAILSKLLQAKSDMTSGVFPHQAH